MYCLDSKRREKELSWGSWLMLGEAQSYGLGDRAERNRSLWSDTGYGGDSRSTAAQVSPHSHSGAWDPGQELQPQRPRSFSAQRLPCLFGPLRH